ncbi:cytochrome P450 94A2-like [Macadamia integrifolia]|uniref:cytochrome P450 94A2-like n=1 Tax=Macadamia integrifolia TaxID=60698 RepID=UPI001C4F1EE5|nr:cytochrome P450 94A2-like [Macadamia integrifolia]
MSQIEFLTPLLLFILPFFFLFFFIKTCLTCNSSNKEPRSYPVLGSILTLLANRERINQWVVELLHQHTPHANGTIILHLSMGLRQVITTNPANVEHILKTQFYLYPKGDFFRHTLSDFLGNGIFNVDGENWRFQRQLFSHEFNTKSLRKFVKTVVGNELSDCLLPLLSQAAAENTVFDLQDILQRFAFDNICKIAFGFDPECLSPSFPQPKSEFAEAFEEATRLSSERFTSMFTLIWKLKRALNIGSERRLRLAISQVREFATKIIEEKKQEHKGKDLLSRILNSGHLDEGFVTDTVISFMLAGRDTTSAALTWFFWLVSCNSHVEEEILKEIMDKPKNLFDYDEVKDMVYTHASLCESMRLYPPIPSDTKFAVSDDVLPDGTVVKKGMEVTYHPYAMGRMEVLWGKNWSEFWPERWLEREESMEKWRFVGRDPYTYPVFQAGPRVCLGKEMAFLQMKSIVAGVMREYQVVPAEMGFEPVFTSFLTSKMKGGFHVTIKKRSVGSGQ